MNISLANVLKHTLCAALALALTVLGTQSVVRSAGLTRAGTPTALVLQQAPAPAPAPGYVG